MEVPDQLFGYLTCVRPSVDKSREDATTARADERVFAIPVIHTWGPSRVTTMIQMIVALALSCILAYHGWSRKALSKSGAAMSFLTGVVHLSSKSWVPATSLLVFYFAGSRLTKYKAEVKAKFEVGVDVHAQGNRTGWQVACNSLVASGIILYMYTLPDDTCPSHGSIHYKLLMMLIAHYSIVAGDTFSSELGILSKSETRLILPPFAAVPKGTNGGVSWFGTYMAICGGFVVGVASYSAWALQCSTAPITVIPFAAYFGLLGSVMDSILGALLQATYQDTKTKKIVPPDYAGPTKKIGPGINLLSNNAVNFTTALVGTLLAASS